MGRRREEWQRAKEHALIAIGELSGRGYEALSQLPEPYVLDHNFQTPNELSKCRFRLYKDTQAGGRLRIAVQVYRHYILGIGRMWADGFFVTPEGKVDRFTERDTWDFT